MRWWRPVAWTFGGAALPLLILILYLMVFSGRVYLQVNSPDGRYIAQWREHCGIAAAMDSCIDSIDLKSRYNPFRHPVFEALRLGRPSIVWLDARTLVVDCPNCGDFRVRCITCDRQPYIVEKEYRWRDVSISYGKLR
jgi:hypothetical protein